MVFFAPTGSSAARSASPRRSKGVLGSYDADRRVLTIVQFTNPRGSPTT